MHLRWVFTVETAVILLKNIFEFTLVRLEGFNNKISTILSVCSTWPSGKALACVSEVLSSIPGITFFSSLLFSSFRLFFFSASFPLVLILGITVLLCFYSLQFLDLHFFLGFTCRSPEVFREVLRFTVLCKFRLHFFCTVLYVFLLLMLFFLSQLFALLALVLS